ncbi:MAG TPA: serine/threonine-protein kinase, partial [Candidatus Obscuribacterales bacterium]
MPSLEKKKGVELYTTCGVCGMPMRQGPGNSLTSWIFRERRCMCARQENSDEPSGNREGKQDNPPPESAKNLSDRYEILATLGQGGMGTVYRVRNKELDKQFALKVLRSELAFDREAVKRFEHEVKAAQSLSHPNLVSVYDFGIGDDGSPFYVMDLIEGETLAGIFRQDGALPFLRVLDIFSQACDALQYAHDHNVIHRDLKPSNILIAKTEDGSDLVKIVDFGIAKILPTPGRETLSLTKTAEIFGSPVYMSPEQCKGDRVDFRSDIYSLGCVLHEALCGRPPFAGENPVKTLLAHIYDAPSLIKETLKEKGLLAELEEVLRTCLAKDPMQRYQSMSSLQHDLHSLKEGRQTAAGRKVASRKRRQHLKFAVVKYFPLVLVLFTTYLLFLAIWDLPFTLAVQDIKLARSVAPKMANNDALDKLLAKADAHNLPFALWMTADIHWQRGDVKRALLDGERALALFENSHRYRNAVWACQLLMRYQLRQGNFAKAEELASHALDLRERSLNAPPEKGLRFIGWFYGPSPSVNSTCLEIAGLLANYGDKSAAKSFYERLLSSMEKHDEAGLGQVLSQYAAFLYSIEDRKKAREVTDQAIARYRMTQDELWRVRDIAAAALNAGDFVAAQDLYTMLDQDGGWMSLPDLMRMAVAYSKTDTDRAHELYQFHVKIRLLSNTDSDRYDYFWQQTCDELFAQGKDGYLDNLFTSMIPILERSSGSEREERSRIELETMYAEYLWKMGRTQESNKYRQQALHEWLSSSRKGNTRHIIKSIYRL